MNGGWIKLYRCLTEKSIWTCSTPEQKVILITLLMMANHSQQEWELDGGRINIKAGQFFTSLEHIAKRCGKGVTVQNVRSALDRFEKYGFLTNKSTNKGRLVTIANWELYQTEELEPTSKLTSNQQATNKQLTSNQQATNKQLTTNKNVKNVKNVKNDKNVKNNMDFSDFDFSVEMENKILDWLTYKQERKESYKSQGLRSLLKQIENKTNQYGEQTVIRLIDESMANNWKGIIWDRLKGKEDRLSVIDSW